MIWLKYNYKWDRDEKAYYALWSSQHISLEEFKTPSEDELLDSIEGYCNLNKYDLSGLEFVDKLPVEILLENVEQSKQIIQSHKKYLQEYQRQLDQVTSW